MIYHGLQGFTTSFCLHCFIMNSMVLSWPPHFHCGPFDFTRASMVLLRPSWFHHSCHSVISASLPSYKLSATLFKFDLHGLPLFFLAKIAYQWSPCTPSQILSLSQLPQSPWLSAALLLANWKKKINHNSFYLTYGLFYLCLLTSSRQY